MAHQQGWQWRENKRALARKERAKAKHFGSLETGKYEQEHNDFFINADNQDNDIGIISEINYGEFKVLFDNVEFSCMLKNELSESLANKLAVGDYVTIESKDGLYFINHAIERKSSLSRMRRDSTRQTGIHESDEHLIAANIDVAVIVASAKNPPLHPKFIDRYLILIENGNIEPVICLNKSDLAGEEEEKILDYYRKIGIKIVKTSATEKLGLDELKEILRGKTSVFVGHSGVGKTSLTNSLIPSENLKVGDVGKVGKGRHTTTSSSFYNWEPNSYIIDTPGIRALEIWDIEKSDLMYYFRECEMYIKNCKYKDCLHDKEPENICGVKQAVKNNDISKERYESYIRILHEL